MLSSRNRHAGSRNAISLNSFITLLFKAALLKPIQSEVELGAGNLAVRQDG